LSRISDSRWTSREVRKVPTGDIERLGRPNEKAAGGSQFNSDYRG
jgi:hypothetical protein